MNGDTTQQEDQRAEEEPRPPQGEAQQAESGQERVDKAIAGERPEPELEPGVARQDRRDQRWRDRAQAAEARAERLATREVVRLLGQRVSDPQAALSLSGQQVADLLTEDGDVDDEAVTDLAERMTTAHPMLRQTSHHLDLGPKASPSTGRVATWGSAIRGR